MILQNWSIQEWNEKLVTQVFLNSANSKTTITRIDASGRLLASCIGQNIENLDLLKQEFIAAFGDTPTEFRSHFIWNDALRHKTIIDGIPAEFAVLYLTLLAASADDNTYFEGDFRKRFAVMIQPLVLNSISFSDLPKMWEHVGEWSRERAKTIGDCSVLVLPDPQRETMIGHSKRLAFPTYKDECNLRDLLKKFNLDSESSFEAISRAIYSELKKFTNSFKEELECFSKLVSTSNNQGAFQSPLWGAVSDISNEIQEEERKVNGRFCLQLDISDPQNPRLILLSDGFGLSQLKSSQYKKLDFVRDGFDYLWSFTDCITSVDILHSFSKEHSGFKKSKPGRALSNGSFIFLPDDIGILSTNGKYFESGPIYFLTKKNEGLKLVARANLFGISYLEINNRDILSEWMLIGFKKCDKSSIQRLLSESDANQILRWRPPQPNLSGGSWYGQALLLNPASNPLVQVPNGSTCKYVLFQENSVISSGELVPFMEKYCIPPVMLTDIDNITSCRLILQNAEQEVQCNLEIFLIHNVPSVKPRQLKNRDEWFIDGNLGDLETLSSIYEDNETDPNLFSKDISNNIAISSRKLFNETNNFNFNLCLKETNHEFAKPIDWLCEALSLRFQGCTFLQFKELYKYIEMVAQATQLKSWILRKLLFSSLWIGSIEKKNAPYPVVIPADRTLSYSQRNECVIVRITGMMSRHERQKLLGKLLSSESAFRTETDDSLISIGCIELHLNSLQRVDELVENSVDDFGFKIVNLDKLKSPLDGLIALSSDLFLSVKIPPINGLEIWCRKERKWYEVIKDEETLKEGVVIRSKGKYKTTYWIRVNSYYQETESIKWAWLLQAAVLDNQLGEIAQNGDIAWSPQLMDIPFILSNWWMHMGGGCISVDKQGRLYFIGGSSVRIWENSIFNHNLLNNKIKDDSPINRRNFALKLKKLRM